MNLLNDIQSGKTKKAYQVYIIEIGIERIQVKVPKSNSAIFEQDFDSALSNQTYSKNELLEIVTRLGGSLKA